MGQSIKEGFHLPYLFSPDQLPGSAFSGDA